VDDVPLPEPKPAVAAGPVSKRKPRVLRQP